MAERCGVFFPAVLGKRPDSAKSAFLPKSLTLPLGKLAGQKLMHLKGELFPKLIS